VAVLADKYEIKGVLGEGGTGIVYDAIKKDDGTSVALKVMHEALAGDKQIRGRFQREAAILRRLEGPHVCAILDFGEFSSEESADPEAPTRLYIAMPKIIGEPLSTLLEKGLIPVDRALDIMIEVLAALSSAHAQGVIHRDLKPANVLIDTNGKAIVGDFGLSKIVTGAGTGTTNLTAHNMLFGTPEYMSPEQARGDELDARCDVYAAGVMLYELLCGQPPFTGETPLGVLTAHLTSDLTPPSQKAGPAARVTPALERVTLKALARDPNERYASAAELAEAIKEARLGSSKADAFAATIPATIGDRPSVDPTAPTLLGDSVIPKAALPSRPPPAPSRRPSKPPPPEASTKTWVMLWIVVIVASIGAGSWFALRH
jgi:serine/threonine-protein kinase